MHTAGSALIRLVGPGRNASATREDVRLPPIELHAAGSSSRMSRSPQASIVEEGREIELARAALTRSTVRAALAAPSPLFRVLGRCHRKKNQDSPSRQGGRSRLCSG